LHSTEFLICIARSKLDPKKGRSEKQNLAKYYCFSALLRYSLTNISNKVLVFPC